MLMGHVFLDSARGGACRTESDPRLVGPLGRTQEGFRFAWVQGDPN